jgi:hypothetical protein
MAKGNNVIVGWFAGHTRKAITNGIPSRLHYCAIFTVYTQFTSVAAKCIIQLGGPGAGDPWSKNNVKLHVIGIHTFSKCFLFRFCR